eukprot:gene11733-3104_t
MPVDLAALAAERRSRKVVTNQSDPSVASNASSARYQAAAAARKAPIKLDRVHRSVQLAHFAALMLMLFGVFFGVLFASWRMLLFPTLAGAMLARAGGAWFHGVLPQMLVKGSPPSQQEMDAAANLIFSLDAVKDIGPTWATASELFTENLAFCCTYGKTNCLTNEMYTGELSVGKCVRLAGNKLAGGTVACA